MKERKVELHIRQPRQLLDKQPEAFLSLVTRKPVCWVSDQVPHKPCCTATEDGFRLEISDLESRTM